jgi:hypothetical protein
MSHAAFGRETVDSRHEESWYPAGRVVPPPTNAVVLVSPVHQMMPVHLEILTLEDGRKEVRVWNAERTQQVIRVQQTKADS